MVAARPRHVSGGGQRRRAKSLHALGIWAVDRQTGEELRRHASTAAVVIVPAAAASTGRLWLAEFTEQRRVLPYVLKTTAGQYISSQEAVVDRERAGVHVADWVDQTDNPASAAQIQPRQRTGLAEWRQMEKRITRQNVITALHEPVVQLHLLFGGWVQLVPHVCPPAGRPKSGDA